MKTRILTFALCAAGALATAYPARSGTATRSPGRRRPGAAARRRDAVDARRLHRLRPPQQHRGAAARPAGRAAGERPRHGPYSRLPAVSASVGYNASFGRGTPADNTC